MYNSLSKFSSLPEETKVFCTHEYTLSNLNFAVEVEPTNKELLKYYEEVSNKRNNNEITLPSNIKLEKNINPFLRSSESSIKKSAEKYSSKSNLDNIETLSVIRSWKDNF